MSEFAKNILLRMSEAVRQEPLFHYHMDHFGVKSPIIYRPGNRVIHIGGGPNRNHPMEVNLNIVPMDNVDIVADASATGLDDASVDVVISNAVLEHVRDLEAVTAEINRILKPGGFLYVEIPFMQAYHTHDSYGVKFEDYRRLTIPGLIRNFEFCQPIDTGVCVGPTSTVLQIMYAYAKDLSVNPLYQTVVSSIYQTAGNAICQLDGVLPKKLVNKSRVPSGIYYFGRKNDFLTPRLQELPWPNSLFPKEISAQITAQPIDGTRWRVEVQNCGDTVWLAKSPLDWGQVRLGLQTQEKDGSWNRDYQRFDLESTVGPEECCSIEIEAPNLDKRCRLDLVCEGLFWFEQKGSLPYSLTLN
jgi:hypothetical protein